MVRRRRGWRGVVAPSRGRGSKQRASLSLPRLSPVAPSRGRGSKRCRLFADHHRQGRRPLTGAWIETGRCLVGQAPSLVAPSRGRGSKPLAFCAIKARSRRPLTGAWIETTVTTPSSRSRTGRPLTGAWIETRGSPPIGAPIWGRPLTGAWIETAGWLMRMWVGMASPPHGGVDRNGVGQSAPAAMLKVAPSRGRGSKPKPPRATHHCRHVAPSRGRGSKLF